MPSFSFDEFVSNAYIGSQITVQKRDGENVFGKLLSITAQSVIVEEPASKFRVAISDKEIECVYLGVYKARGEVRSNSTLDDFLQKRYNIIYKSKLTFSTLFFNEIESAVQLCENAYLKEYLAEELANKKSHFRYDVEKEFLSLVQEQETQLCEHIVEFNIVKTILYFHLKDYKNVYRTILESFPPSSSSLQFKLLACVCYQTNNLLGTLFWLGKFFDSSSSISENEFLWWSYLRLVSKYSVYTSCIDLLCDLAKRNPELSIQSFAYLLSSYNCYKQAEYFMELLNNGDIVHDITALIRRNSVHLISEADNNYQRYLRCLTCILTNEGIKYYNDDEIIGGYIYEYIPEKEFGFILGFDLISYFFHDDTLKEKDNNVIAEIRRNIAAPLSVESEKLIKVSFKRSLLSKKSYSAFDIYLW